MKGRGTASKKLPAISELVKESLNGPWKSKCQYDLHDYKNEPITADNYHVDMVTLRSKRSIQ
jgi:hypothetical protein